MPSALSQSERDHLAELERRLDTPLRERMRQAGYDPSGPAQISASVESYRVPQKSYAAPHWSGQGVDGVKHDDKGRVYFTSPQGKKNYLKSQAQEGQHFADLTDFDTD